MEISRDGNTTEASSDSKGVHNTTPPKGGSNSSSWYYISETYCSGDEKTSTSRSNDLEKKAERIKLLLSWKKEIDKKKFNWTETVEYLSNWILHEFGDDVLLPNLDGIDNNEFSNSYKAMLLYALLTKILERYKKDLTSYNLRTLFLLIFNKEFENKDLMESLLKFYKIKRS